MECYKDTCFNGHIQPTVEERPLFTEMENEFIALVNDRQDVFTKLERRIAAYFVAHPTALLVDIFCDELCDWATSITPYVVALPSEEGFFFRPTTAIHFSLNLLIQDVIDELGESVRDQMKLLSQAQELFGQYMK